MVCITVHVSFFLLITQGNDTSKARHAIVQLVKQSLNYIILHARLNQLHIERNGLVCILYLYAYVWLLRTYIKVKNILIEN